MKRQKICSNSAQTQSYMVTFQPAKIVTVTFYSLVFKVSDLSHFLSVLQQDTQLQQFPLFGKNVLRELKPAVSKMSGYLYLGVLHKLYLFTLGKKQHGLIVSSYT